MIEMGNAYMAVQNAPMVAACVPYIIGFFFVLGLMAGRK